MLNTARYNLIHAADIDHEKLRYIKVGDIVHLRTSPRYFVLYVKHNDDPAIGTTAELWSLNSATFSTITITTYPNLKRHRIVFKTGDQLAPIDRYQTMERLLP